MCLAGIQNNISVNNRDMKTENDILSRIGRRDGMTVPEGFFEDFAMRMGQELPYRSDAEKVEVMPRRTVWERVRPYVYMAAMFAGIWCMLKMFTMMSPGSVDLSIENNRVLTEALSDDDFVYDYIIDDINDREIFEEMYDDSISLDEMIPAESLPDMEMSETDMMTSEIPAE